MMVDGFKKKRFYLHYDFINVFCAFFSVCALKPTQDDKSHMELAWYNIYCRNN